MTEFAAFSPSAVPAISVLLTAWNGALYLQEAIDSIVAQKTSHVWELILIDDGSTDDTLAIMRRAAKTNPSRVKVVQHPDRANHGMSASRNFGLQQARGAVIAFLDADDIWLPHHLETQMQALAAHPTAAMTYTLCERWYDYAVPFGQAKRYRSRNHVPPLVPPGEAPGLVPQGKLLDWILADERMVPCICSMLVRAAEARAVGGFVEQFRGLYEDQAFYTKISLRYPVYANNICTSRYRQHDQSCCQAADGATWDAAVTAFKTWLSIERTAGAAA